jgi:hypothetical protein
VRVFRQTDPSERKGVCREEEPVLGRADRGGAEAGGDGHADRGRHAQLGISEQTFYRWKKAYGGLQPDQARELKQLQEENARLNKLVADLSLDKEILRDIAAKKWGGPGEARGGAVHGRPSPHQHPSVSSDIRN